MGKITLYHGTKNVEGIIECGFLMPKKCDYNKPTISLTDSKYLAKVYGVVLTVEIDESSIFDQQDLDCSDGEVHHEYVIDTPIPITNIEFP